MIAKVRLAPDGAIDLLRGDERQVPGSVEVEWHADRLRIRAIGAGRASIAGAYPSHDGEDVVVEIRPETVPGAD